MPLSDTSIREITLAVIALINTIVITVGAIALRRTREKVDTIDTKVDAVHGAVRNVSDTVNTVHGLVDSQHSELKGELKKANEFSERALKLVVAREGMPPDSGSGDD